MPTPLTPCPARSYCVGSLLALLLILLVSACTSPNHRVTASDAQLPEASLPTLSEDWLPVTRRGRYTLVTLAPRLSQHNLLLQEVHVTLPTGSELTVGDGLRRVLLNSGYSLCADTPATELLFNLPLPAPHHQLGPVLLQDALQVLAGPAWTLEVDVTTRQVCFQLAATRASSPGARP